VSKETYYRSKETYYMRRAHLAEGCLALALLALKHLPDLAGLKCQKRPTIGAKETWRRAASRSTCWRSNICRILPASCLLLLRSCCSSCWLRAIVSSTSKETYYGEKIDLLYAEKRPAICGKETYYMPTFESLPAGCAQSLP
jgi:hypothetical protein